MDWRTVAAASALLAGIAATTACGGSGNGYGSSTTAPSPPAPSTASTIAIVGQNGTQAFTPNPSAFGGMQVVFKNNDNVTHHIVLNDGSADAGVIAPGGTSSAITFPSGGTNYHCTIHPGMIGSSSAASGGPPPMCDGPYCNAY